MYLFDRKSSFFFVTIALFLLFFPKINFISYGGRETAGIRLDDILLVSFSFVLLWGHIALKHQLSPIEKTVVFIAIFSFLSFFLNRFYVNIGWLHVDASILYVIRIFEYFVFYYVGYYALRHYSMTKVIFYYFLYNVILILLQKGGFIGYFGIYGYKPTCTYRCTGIASFPSEMGMLLNMFFCFMLFQKDHLLEKVERFFFYNPFAFLLVKKIYPFFMFVLVGSLIAFNGSRIAFAAHLLSYFLYLFIESKRKILVLSTMFSLLVLSGFSLNGKYFDNTLFNRCENLFSKNNLQLIEKVWDRIDVRYVPIGKEIVKQEAEEDTSWWIRIHKWLYGLKIYYQHPESYLFGVGPGFAMAGLDGGILRIFIEYGLIGSIVFGSFFYKIGKSSRVLAQWVIVFCVNMLFFDVHLAYKPMSLLFLLTGYTYAENYSSSLKR